MRFNDRYTPADARAAARAVLRTQPRTLHAAQAQLAAGPRKPALTFDEAPRVYEVAAAIQYLSQHDLDPDVVLALRDRPWLTDEEAFAILGSGLSAAEVAAASPAQEPETTAPDDDPVATWWPTRADTQTHRTMAALRGFEVLAVDERTYAAAY